MNKKIFFIAFNFLIVLSAMSAERIRVGLPMDIKLLDPFDLSYIEEFEVFGSVHDTLLSYQASIGLSPVLAERWEFDEFNKTLKFHLKTKLFFSNGESLTAKDVEMTLKRLLLLDKHDSLILTKCLKLKDKTFNDIFQNHPKIQVVSDNTIIIGPTDCRESLVKQLSDPTYGIISRKFIGNNLKIMESAPSSGAFSYKKNTIGFSLIPNERNWRWGKNIKNRVILDFVKIDQDFSSILKNKVDVFRTSKQHVVDEAIKNNFNLIVSVPVMVWFITSDEKDLKKAQPFLNMLNTGDGVKKYSVFDENHLEIFADNFFPKDFNCGPVTMKRPLVVKKTSKGIVRLVNHVSGESKIFINDIKKDLESHGVVVLIDDQKNNFETQPVKLILERKFLDDKAQTALDYTYRVFKNIPDPSKKIIKQLEFLDQKNLSLYIKEKSLKKVCSDQYLFNHVPLAHRKYAFLYKNEKAKEIFFKGSGNLIYNEIIK